ncbi:MAG TPA: hypothetical protein VH253_15980 [Phycisphaerae bacterium]|nr:hypothetical protein [Phycisphaerae bacterium]
MKRAVACVLVPAAVLVAGMMAGCGPSESDTITYDPHLDGVAPPPAATPNLDILKNQVEIYNTQSAGLKSAAPAPSQAPASAPAATPATAPAGTPPPASPAPPNPTK